jgi:hypothetical protein
VRLTLIGYWFGPAEEGWPNAQDFVDPDWNQAERVEVIGWLDSGHLALAYRGYSRCRFCGCLNGTSLLSDGTYVWPDGLAHYLRDHGVRLPAAVVKHVLSRPSIDQSQLDQAMADDDVDTESWREQLPEWSHPEVS